MYVEKLLGGSAGLPTLYHSHTLTPVRLPGLAIRGERWRLCERLSCWADSGIDLG